MTRFLMSAAAALFFAIPASQAADADPLRPQVSVQVAYGDLDLSSPAGARTMINRLRSATRKICGDEPAPMQIAMILRHKSCFSTTMTQAVASLDHPVVSAAYAGHAGAQTAAR